MGNEGGYLPDGIGWYRKTLNMQKAWMGKRVMVCFDGVYMDSKVFVVSVQTEIKNEGTTSKTIKVKASVASAEASATSSDITLEAGETQVVSQQLTISNPKLWRTESPNLYEAKVEIVENHKVIDQKKETFGVRSIEYDAQNGLRINGEKTLIYGGCAHHDNGMLGSATFTNAEYRKVKLMKDAGFNLVRTSHNPPSEDFLRACDELGLMVIDEAFDGWVDQKNKNDYHLRFKEESSNDVADRELPSRCFQKLGNGE